jgi:dephospho-CoA kinase
LDWGENDVQTMAGRRDHPLRIGLTGGIASGKSTVAECFARLGVPVIDTDQLARAVVEPAQPALAAVAAAFGPDLLAPGGRLNRAKMRARIFADPDARTRLEAILHPRIRNATLAAAQAAGGHYQLIVVPLLFESGFDALVDRVLVVDCPEELQRERLAERDGETPDSIARILAAQLPRGERLARADDVISNDGKLGELHDAVADLHHRYLDLARIN